jgi:hypothetical protein
MSTHQLATEIFALAQTRPGGDIEDAVARIEAEIKKALEVEPTEVIRVLLSLFASQCEDDGNALTRAEVRDALAKIEDKASDAASCLREDFTFSPMRVVMARMHLYAMFKAFAELRKIGGGL